MSALGQKQTFDDVRRMSALPPKADIAESHWHVRFVPKADIEAPVGYVRPTVWLRRVARQCVSCI
jgi:hypothetical protein